MLKASRCARPVYQLLAQISVAALGMAAPKGKRNLEQFLIVLMDEQGGAGLSPRMVMLVADARMQWAELDRRIAAFDAEFVHRSAEVASICFERNRKE